MPSSDCLGKASQGGHAKTFQRASLAGFGAWVFSLPPTSAAAEAPPVPENEIEAMLASLKPPMRERPLVAIIGINDATETTDYLMPTGILRRADVADVVTLATGPGPVRLYPALAVEADATIAEFDARDRLGRIHTASGSSAVFGETYSTISSC